MVSAQDIENWIKAGLPGSVVNVQGDDGVHFSAVIISEQFAAKNRVARQRMVYAALGDKMVADIHALSMQTFTPDEAP